jgi:hypothetical protein
MLWVEVIYFEVTVKSIIIYSRETRNRLTVKEGIENNIRLTDTLKQTNSWKTDSGSAGQETLHLSLNSKVNYCVHKCPLIDTILNQMNPAHSLFMINFMLTFHPGRSLPSGLFSSVYPTNILHAFLIIVVVFNKYKLISCLRKHLI